VNGAKAHLTGITNAHEVIVLPTQAMKHGQEDYAIAFAIPMDAPGINHDRGSSRAWRHPQAGEHYHRSGQCPLRRASRPLTVFDHVVRSQRLHLPQRRDRFCRHAGGALRRLSSANSYGGCKSGVGDVAIGAATLIAQYNGTEKATPREDKLIEMTQLNEQLYCAGNRQLHRGLSDGVRQLHW